MEDVSYWNSRRFSHKSLICLAVLFSLLMYPLESEAVFGKDWWRCPDHPVQQNFSTNEFLGKWYVQSAYNCYESSRCVSVQFSYNPQGDVVGYFEGWTRKGSVENYQTGTTILRLDDLTKEDGKMTADSKHENAITPEDGPFWILGTDYTTYAVVFECQNEYLVLHDYEVVIYSRQRTVKPDFFDNAYRALEEANMSSKKMVRVNQNGCNKLLKG